MECVEKRCLLPVTALQFYSFHGSKLLFSGEGPWLKVFSEDGELLCMQEALPFKRLHGIRPVGDTSGVLLAFGQKSFAISQLTHGDECAVLSPVVQTQYTLCAIAKATEVSDWILDAVWLVYRNQHCYRIVFMTAHNAVLVYSVTPDSSTVCTYHSEVNCILYSSCVLCDSSGDLTIASGTVFNKILLWRLRDPTADNHASDTRVRVCLTLAGHEGVIFSIKFSDDRSQVISASDDRTIRVWNLPPDWMSLQMSDEMHCSLTLYGHTARVWDARLLSNCIVSIGEDVTCRVWDLQGHSLQVVKGHKGRSIWSLAIDHERQVVATGGGDCSVRIFQIFSEGADNDSFKAVDTRLPRQGEGHMTDTPRSVALSGKTALCLTSDGYLYAADVCGSLHSTSDGCAVWRELCHDADFSGYCVLAVCESHPSLVSIGNLKGTVKLLSISDAGLLSGVVQWRAHEGKVFSLNWTTSSTPDSDLLLFSCGPGGAVVCWNIQREDGGSFAATSVATLSLPPSKHRWLSAVAVCCKNLKLSSLSGGVAGAAVVLCGDRKGSLHVYHCTLEPSQTADSAVSCLEPVQSLRLHGPNGVTCIVAHGSHVYTAGRDGYCRRFAFEDNGLMTELTKFKPVKGMDWIEKLLFYKEDLLVLGFHAVNMVLHSTTQNKHILEVNCGGGHRSYGISPFDDVISNRRIVVLFVKQSSLCFRRVDLGTYFTQPVLQPPFVGREAVSLCTVHENQTEGRHLVAVGSEDCTVSLVRICPGSVDATQCINVVKTLQGHISSVRALGCSNGVDRKLLFSGGARASLKVWSIRQGTVCEELDVTLDAELFLHDDPAKSRRRKLKLSNIELPPECRVMSVTAFELCTLNQAGGSGEAASFSGRHYVAVGCSDAIIKQYIYNEREKAFTQVPSLVFHNKCILCVHHFFHHAPVTPTQTPVTPTQEALLCSTATDGRVALWNLQDTLDQWSPQQPVCQPPSDGPHEGGRGMSVATAAVPDCVFRAHQSGINAISLHAMGNNRSHLIASVGDDNALTVSEIAVDLSVSTGSTVASLIRQCSEVSAHSSSITGVEFLKGDLLVTTSIDQRINLWSYHQNTLKLTSSFTHDVADVASLQVLRHRSDCVGCVVLCGIGLQYCCFKWTEHC